MLVVHVELGGLAEALPAARAPLPAPPTGAGGAPRARAGGTPRRPRRRPAARAPPPPAPAPASSPPTPPPSGPCAPSPKPCKYAQWRREAAEPGRVPEYEDIDEDGAAAD